MGVFTGCESSAPREVWDNSGPDVSDGGRAYAMIIKDVYTQAWTPSSGISNPRATAKAVVVVAKDGRVISAKITESSGDAKMNESVQTVLKQIKTVPPFERDAKVEQRTFSINFDLKAKA